MLISRKCPICNAEWPDIWMSITPPCPHVATNPVIWDQGPQTTLYSAQNIETIATNTTTEFPPGFVNTVQNTFAGHNYTSSTCDCDLRARRWNPHSGICETCRCKFNKDR